MTCAEFETRLSAYMDGELSRWKRWKVQTHLRACPECQALLTDLESVDACLHCAAEATPAPEYLTGAVMHRVPAMPPAWRRHGAMLPWAAGLAVAGMQAAALCGAYWWGFNRGTVSNGGLDRSGVLQTSPVMPVRNDPPAEPERGSAFNPGRLWSSHPAAGSFENYQPDPVAVRALTAGNQKTTNPSKTFGRVPSLQLEGAH